MLTLTRKVGQKILVGDDIEIVIREIRGRQVRIGIVAPPGVPVFREEVAPKIGAPTTDAPTADAPEATTPKATAPKTASSEPSAGSPEASVSQDTDTDTDTDTD